jgi:RNA polymerase sigma factor (sigma-70 family)
MVLAVCRRVLGNHADAEDAFQATFLVLVRKAVSLRAPGTVGNWLYGVAYNTALKARAMNSKRRLKEREAGARPQQDPVEEAWRSVQAKLDAALVDLPEKYRLPIVLCDLEGKTIKETARHLDWPQGTVATRLARGRSLLAARLRDAGLLLSVAALAAALSEGAAAANVPVALFQSTVHAGSLWATGPAVAAGVVSAKVVALSEGVLQAMFLAKLKSIVASGFLALLIGAGAGVFSHYTSAQESLVRGRNFEAPVQAQADDIASLKREIERLRAELARTRLELQRAQQEVIVLKAKSELEKAQAEAARLKAEAERAKPADPKNKAKAGPMPPGGGFAPGPNNVPGLPFPGKGPGGLPGDPGGGFQGNVPGAAPPGIPGAPGGIAPGGNFIPGAGPPGFPGPLGGGFAPKTKETAGVTAIAPDGRVVAVSSKSAITVIDIASGKIVYRSEGHAEPVTGLAFSPDGKVLASGSKDKSVIIWETATGKQLRQVKVESPVVTLRFSPDGRTIQISGTPGTVIEIDLQTGTVVRPEKK